jgi:crotonobetainyl-CoA:carnitine CoA-transferase CaiB-like acyl-CoA transferase
MMEAQRSRGPLAGIRVIELADEQAECCGLTLAGLGADVIKIEPPGGNATRRIGPFYEDREDRERSLFFWQYNRGKRSIVLDLQGREDQDRFRALVASADVLLESTPRGELDARGLGAALRSAITARGPTSRARTWSTWRSGA